MCAARNCLGLPHFNRIRRALMRKQLFTVLPCRQLAQMPLYLIGGRFSLTRASRPALIQGDSTIGDVYKVGVIRRRLLLCHQRCSVECRSLAQHHKRDCEGRREMMS